MEDPMLSMFGGEVGSGRATLSTWGPFRLIAKVGQRAFGEVYRAWDPVLEREVALKLLILGTGPEGDDAYKSILREARQMAKVRHPNVVSVHGVDKHEGRVGFWSDFVRGKTLSDLLQAQGQFGAREASFIGLELCRAISAVHAAGLLHRDIKAGNAMREEGGRILLMDFGLTHNRGGRHFGGTPQYMAPEFVRVVETALDPDPKKRFVTAGQMSSALSDALSMGPATAEAFAIAAPLNARRFRLWMLVPVLAAMVAIGYFATRPSARTIMFSSAHKDYERRRTCWSIII